MGRAWMYISGYVFQRRGQFTLTSDIQQQQQLVKQMEMVSTRKGIMWEPGT